jgi:ABC-2 type transport system ATP-binding protein
MTHSSTSRPTPILEARGLVKRYRRGREALAGIDLVLDGGGLTALVGPNGAGKSTLIKAWVGLERPSRGQVFVRGIDPWRDRRTAVRQLGYVPQAPALYRELSVGQHVAYAAAVRPGFDRMLAERRLSDLGIPLDQRAGELSGGQQAQTGLALALGSRAPVLILDEPLASLDPLARREFLHVLSDAMQAGDVSALLSSHVISDIEQACDRVVVLGNGRKLLDASLGAAVSRHRVAAAGTVASHGPLERVATFADAERRQLDLWRLSDEAPRALEADLREATLEEVVLGYLASAREQGPAA